MYSIDYAVDHSKVSEIIFWMHELIYFNYFVQLVQLGMDQI